MALDLTQASDLLSEYLSALLRVPIGVPVPILNDPAILKLLPEKLLISDFLLMMPQVVQKAVDGAEIWTELPLVAQGKGTTLSLPVSNVVNELLYEHRNTHTDGYVFGVPTFFYADGSMMVIRFTPKKLFVAVVMLTKSPSLVNFVTNAIGGLKGAYHAS